MLGASVSARHLLLINPPCLLSRLIESAVDTKACCLRTALLGQRANSIATPFTIPYALSKNLAHQVKEIP